MTDVDAAWARWRDYFYLTKRPTMAYTRMHGETAFRAGYAAGQEHHSTDDSCEHDITEARYARCRFCAKLFIDDERDAALERLRTIGRIVSDEWPNVCNGDLNSYCAGEICPIHDVRREVKEAETEARPESRSVQRRKAAQRGEPTPTFETEEK